MPVACTSHIKKKIVFFFRHLTSRKGVKKTDNTDFNITFIYNFYESKNVSITYIPFPGGSPLGPAHEAFVLGLFGSASGEAS